MEPARAAGGAAQRGAVGLYEARLPGTPGDGHAGRGLARESGAQSRGGVSRDRAGEINKCQGSRENGRICKGQAGENWGGVFIEPCLFSV